MHIPSFKQQRRDRPIESPAMKDLTQGHEGRLIIKFALPLVVGNMLQQTYNIVDSIIVGRVLGKEAIAAVGASFPVIYTLIAFTIGIGSGASVVVSQYFGAREYEKVKRATSTIFIFLFFASIIVTLVSILFSRQIFEMLNIESHVSPLAIKYFNIYMSGMVAFFGFNGISSVLRGMGDSMTPLWFMLIATVSNILLDLLFVLVFNWGIEGVAWATVIAHVIPFILGAIYLTRRHQFISFHPRKMCFDRSLFKQSMRIGLPTGFQQTFVAFGMTALLRIVTNFDTSVLAAYTIAGRIDSLAGMPALNLSSALSSFVGQNLGAGRIDRIKKGFWASLYMSWGISLLVMTVVFIWGEHLIAAFNRDPMVIKYGTDYLHIISSFYIIYSSMFITHGVLRGAGDTIVPMFVSLISLWIVRIPLALYLSPIMGVDGIWWSIPIGWTIGYVLTQLYYLSGRWKRKAITRKQQPNVIQE
ncbi:putative MATE family efflux protein [Breznakibacter xylanolyticus]|uniref:Multidrug-efflux transporter n=2 Tax=Breznakibacter xylanolyticus TaxID=990 RepID=A0A2W7NVA3_9BACT|nr:putative MATE family efflux protein [Breznakibacter xylanolyticus]